MVQAWKRGVSPRAALRAAKQEYVLLAPLDVTNIGPLTTRAPTFLPNIPLHSSCTPCRDYMGPPLVAPRGRRAFAGPFGGSSKGPKASKGLLW